MSAAVVRLEMIALRSIKLDYERNAWRDLLSGLCLYRDCGPDG